MQRLLISYCILTLSALTVGLCAFETNQIVTECEWPVFSDSVEQLEDVEDLAGALTTPVAAVVCEKTGMAYGIVDAFSRVKLELAFTRRCGCGSLMAAAVIGFFTRTVPIPLMLTGVGYLSKLQNNSWTEKLRHIEETFSHPIPPEIAEKLNIPLARRHLYRCSTQGFRWSQKQSDQEKKEQNRIYDGIRPTVPTFLVPKITWKAQDL